MSNVKKSSATLQDAEQQQSWRAEFDKKFKPDKFDFSENYQKLIAFIQSVSTEGFSEGFNYANQCWENDIFEFIQEHQSGKIIDEMAEKFQVSAGAMATRLLEAKFENQLEDFYG